MDNCSAASMFLTDSLELELGTDWCKPPCFSCGFDNRGGGSHFSGESYLSSGALKRWVKNLYLSFIFPLSDFSAVCEECSLTMI